MPQPSAPPPPPFPTHRAAGAAPSSQLWPPFSSFSHSFPSSPPPPPPSGPARCTAPPPGAYRPPCASAGRPPAPSVSSCASQPPAFGSAGGQTSRPSPSPPPPSASPSLAPPSLPPRPAFAAAGSHWAGGPSAVPPPPSQSSVSPPPPPCASSLSAASAASPSALGRCLRAHSAGAESAGAASERRCCSWCAPAPPACPACSCQAAPAASAPAASCAGCAACCSPSHASAFQRCASHAPPCPPGSSACARCCGAASAACAPAAACSVPPPPPPPSFSPPQAHDAAARVAQGAPPLRPPPAFRGPPGVPTGLPRTGAAASGSDGSAAVCAPSPPAAGGEDACCWPGRQQEATSPAGAADGAAVSAHPPPPSSRAWNAPSPSPAPPPGHQGATGAGVAPVSAAEPTRRDGCYGSAVPPPPPPASEANVGARAAPWAGKRQGAWEGQDASAKKRRKEDEFVCLICDKTFRSAKRQQQHEEEEHLPCDYPGCTYSGPVHVMVMHKLKHLKNEKGESLLDSESEVAAWLAARKENFPSFRKNPKPKTPGPARPPPRPKSVLERILRETMESAYGRRLIHPAFFSSAFCPELPKMLAAPPPIYSLKREFRYATLPRSPYSHPSGLCPSSFLLPPGAKGPGRDVRSTGRGSGPEVPLRPPLLYQLLAPEIRGYEVKLIAAIQFIVQSNFFMNEPRAEAEKERLIEVVEEKAVDGETDDCAQGSHAAAQAIAAEGEGATD